MPEKVPSDPSAADPAVLTEWSADPSDWDAFVEAHPWGTVYHLTAWRRVIEEAFPHIEGRFLLLRSSADGRLLGGLPLYIVRSWLLGNRAVSVPFASFSDPLAPDGALLSRLIDEAWRFARARKLSSLEVRMFRSGPPAADSAPVPALYSRHHGADLTRPVDEIWASLSKTSVRQPVERAEKAGVRVSSCLDDADLRTFKAMVTETRRRRSLPDLPFRFFAAMKRHLAPDRLSCWIARDPAGKPLAGLMGWRLADLFAVEYAGDFVEARAVGANQLLFWRIMQVARSLGCRTFSFGRTGLDNEGLRRYKLHWGTVEEDLKMILLPPDEAADIGKTRMSFRLAQGLIAHSPRPLYKLIGDFCYRHLG